MRQRKATLYSVPYNIIAPENYMSTLVYFCLYKFVGRISNCIRYGWGLREPDELS